MLLQHWNHTERTVRRDKTDIVFKHLKTMNNEKIPLLMNKMNRNMQRNMNMKKHGREEWDKVSLFFFSFF